MKIIIAGGSGHLGTILAKAFHEDGDEVVILSRHGRPGEHPWRSVRWDAATEGAWTHELEGADAVINLAGRSVDCRYTEHNRRAIAESRIVSTAVLGRAIAHCGNPPRVWLQASTATIYAHRYDAANDEHTGQLGGAEPGVPKGWRFSTDVARAWERACMTQELPRTRRVLLRAAMVMSRERGGALAKLRMFLRLGIGGTHGDGRQYMSWIHEADFVRAVRFLIDRNDIDGPVNLAAPHPLPERDFLAALREACGTRLAIPMPRWLLEIGAFVLRTETELVLKSRRVVPARLLWNGFTFEYPHWADAARELCGRGTAKGEVRWSPVW
jgi:uncharacterized protein